VPTPAITTRPSRGSSRSVHHEISR
jgi:hypothetical protein